MQDADLFASTLIKTSHGRIELRDCGRHEFERRVGVYGGLCRAARAENSGVVEARCGSAVP